MAKKSRRARTVVAPGQPRVGSGGSEVTEPVRPVRPIQAPVARGSREIDFRKEYPYVISDLKRMGIIALALLVLLIILALIIA